LSDPRLVAFVRNSLQKGLGRTEIEQALAQKGWTGVQVSEAFADAQSTAASSTSKTIAAASSGKTLYIILGVLMILFVAVGIAIVFWPTGDTDECSSSRDCGSGYDCIGGECILSVDEEPSTRTTTTTVEEEEPECYFDSDCDDSYECSEDYTCELEETTTTTTTTATSADPNYLIDYVKFDYVTTSFLSLKVNVSNDEDASTTDKMYLGCYVTDNVTSETYLGLNKEGTPDGLDSIVRTCGVEINGTLLYSTLLDKSPIKFTVNTTVDYYDNITETDEEDNSLVTSFEVFEEDMTFVLSSIVCSTDTGCATLLNSSYECSSNGYCAAVVETATLSEDCSALTCESPYVCSSSNVCVECDDDTDCTSGVCSDDNVCVECFEDSNCDDGYECSSSNVCVIESEVCDNLIDDNADSEIDYYGGCEIADGDDTIDYVCGCIDSSVQFPASITDYEYFGNYITCSSGYEYGCGLVENDYDILEFEDLTCGTGSDIEGTYYGADEQCVLECTKDSDCTSGICEEFVCVAVVAEDCSNTIDDDGDGYADSLDSDCYECTSDSDCGDSSQYCESNICIDKTSCNVFDSPCRPFACDKTNKYCYIECSSNDECANGYSCSSGECVVEEEVDCDCEDGYYCTEEGGECIVTKCNDGKDNDGDGDIDYSGVVSFSDGTYISCKDDVGASVYSKYVEDFRLSYENDEMHYLEGNLGYTCYDEFFEKMDAWLITYSDYTVSTACKSFCEIFYEVYYDTCNEEFSSEFPVSCTYYEEDSVCEDINTNAERSISSVRAAELEQNIFMRILNFVIESNPVIDLFRKK